MPKSVGYPPYLKIHRSEHGAEIYGAELDAKIYGIKVAYMSVSHHRHVCCDEK